MSSIKLDNIEKKYGKVHAVRGISMDIADGEFISFLGPSGCGKSSTMRMITGLEEITGGDILFDGKSVIAKKPSDRNVAMAFENYALYPTLTVYENIAFPLRAAGVHKDEVDRRVKEIADVVGLTDLLDKKTTGLSSGQAQAIGVARALIRKPNVLLLDEPISHLDTSQRFQMRMYIKRLHIDLGYTMILVTHDQEDAMSMADRVAIMEAGSLHQIASPREVYDNPADLFVASFIGDIPMNFLNCTVEQENGSIYLRHGAEKLPLPERYKGAELPKEVVLGVRPYNFKIGAPDMADCISGTIINVEGLGDMNELFIQVGEAKFNIAVATRFKPKKGDKIGLALKPGLSTLFDKATTKAIKAV